MKGFNVVDSSLLVVLSFKHSTDLSLEAKRIAMLLKTSEGIKNRLTGREKHKLLYYI
jgi:hypothetical protein